VESKNLKKIVMSYVPTRLRADFADEVIKAHNKIKEKPKHYDNSNGVKESTGKLTYELDFNFIESMAARMANNKGKYKPYNWQKPIDIDQLKQSLFRHCMEVMKDNYEDEGDALGHLEAIAINAMIINYQLKNK
jgi:hypothetical protein